MNNSVSPNGRYLWAVGTTAEQIAPGEQVADRYQAIAPQLWYDTQPDQPPEVPPEIPAIALPYMHLYHHCLHVPELYGFCSWGEGAAAKRVMLLENIPVDASGQLYPSLKDAWPKATAVRQLYWLWQILQLWEDWREEGVASSWLVAEDIRVEGWRVWLRQLALDRAGRAEADSDSSGRGSTIIPDLLPQLSLQDLGQCWADWFETGTQPAIAEPLQTLFAQMQAEEATLAEIKTAFNRLLLEQSAQLPLRLTVAGLTDTGPRRKHNEDTCYPTPQDLACRDVAPNSKLIPYFSIVCDGIGGHAGGEVASQLALQSLKPQIQTLLQEATQQASPIAPELICKQLEAILRVANNLISERNNQQKREDRQRMGTTLVMALQLPQRIETAAGAEFSNTGELYVANVGDSRAYWITPQYCQQLTVDDDVATRETRLGRAPHRQGTRSSYGAALTQALGTRDSDLLRPVVQRFVIEEDGLLLLCSDGLSDFDRVEQSWQSFAGPILSGKLTVEDATRAWVDLANQENGHDNTSVVLTCCRVSPDYPVLSSSSAQEDTLQLAFESQDEADAEGDPGELSEASKALLYDETNTDAPSEVSSSQKRGRWMTVLGAGLLLVAAAAGGLFLWQRLNPDSFNQWRDRIPGLQQTD